MKTITQNTQKAILTLGDAKYRLTNKNNKAGTFKVTKMFARTGEKENLTYTLEELHNSSFEVEA